MLSSQDIQNMYIKLYKYLRNYIWSIQVVEVIADLEVACYKSFPSIDDIINHLSKLKSLCSDVLKEDSQFDDCLNEFLKEMTECEGIYNKITQVNEVISV